MPYKDPVKAAEQKRKWAEAHPEYYRKFHRKWRRLHLKCARATQRRWYWRHRKKALVKSRKWRATHSTRVRELNRKWAEANPGRAKVRYAVDPERCKGWTRKWQRANPGKAAQIVANYRARVFKVSGTHTFEEWKNLLRESGFRCRYCGCRLGYQGIGFPEAKTATRDHVVPLTRGGSNDIETSFLLVGPATAVRVTGAK